MPFQYDSDTIPQVNLLDPRKAEEINTTTKADALGALQMWKQRVADLTDMLDLTSQQHLRISEALKLANMVVVGLENALKDADQPMPATAVITGGIGPRLGYPSGA